MDSEIKIIYCLLLLGISKADQEKILSIPSKMFSKEANEILKRCKLRMVNNELIDASLLTENDGKIAYKIEKIEAYNERLDLYIKDLKQDYIKKVTGSHRTGNK